MTESPERPTPTKVLANSFQLALGVFAIGLPALYALGRVYEEGYWNTIQMPQLADHAVEDYVYLGFMAILNAAARLVGAQGLMYLLIAGLVLTAIAFYIVVLEKWFIPTLMRSFRRIRIRDGESKSTDRRLIGHFPKALAAPWAAVLSFGLLFLGLFFTVGVPVAGMYKAGQQQANRDRERLVSYGSEPTIGAEPVVHYEEKGEARMALMLRCEGDWCIVFEHGSFAAVKAESVQRVDHCPRRYRLKNGFELCDELSRPVP